MLGNFGETVETLISSAFKNCFLLVELEIYNEYILDKNDVVIFLDKQSCLNIEFYLKNLISDNFSYPKKDLLTLLLPIYASIAGFCWEQGFKILRSFSFEKSSIKKFVSYN